MKRRVTTERYALAALLNVTLLAVTISAHAQAGAAPSFGGDFWSRSRLTGDWLGVRDDLANRGVTLDIDLLLTPQSVASGGRSTDAEFWGNADYTLSVDSGKLGLWPGGLLRVWADSGFGNNVFHDSGVIVPVNTAALLPAPGDQTTALVEAAFTQFLSPKIAVSAGKIGLLDSPGDNFAGNYRTQFMNTGLAFPITLIMVPLSAFGGGVSLFPIEGLSLSALALDPSGTPTSNTLSDAFDDGVLLFSSATAHIHPFQLGGHQTVGFVWSNKQHLSLIQDPSNLARSLLTQQYPRLANPGPALEQILVRFFPKLAGPTQPINTENDTWAMYYSFDQYLWQPKSDSQRGVGMFFSFGASDGNPNPLQYFYALGLGGNGVVPGRPKDTFGIGWARTQFSDDFVPLLRKDLNIGLGSEDAIEMYYNVGLSPWLVTSLDVQIIDSGLQKRLNSSGTLSSLNTVFVAGLRIYVRL